MCRLIFIICFALAGIHSIYAKNNTLTGLKFQTLPNNRLRIDFQFAEPIQEQPASFITQKPTRLVLDFVDTINQLDPKERQDALKASAIKSYRVVSVKDRVRMMFDLSAQVTYTGAISGRVFTLWVTGQEEALVPRLQGLMVPSRPLNTRFCIKKIDYRGTDKQGGRLIVDLSAAGVPVEVTQKGQNVQVRFNSTCVPGDLLKRYDVSDFHSPTQTFTVRQEGKNVVFNLHNNGDFSQFSYQVNKQFIVDVVALSPDEVQHAKLKKSVFVGKRISLNFQKIAVPAVLQLLADFTGVNIVLSDQVKQEGNVTLRLNDVPWDQALDIILTTQGLAKQEVGNVILIDKITNFSKREQDKLKEIEKYKKLAPIRSDLIQINYAKASDIAVMLKDKNTSLLSEHGNVSVDTRTNTIWIQDTGERIQEVRDLIEKLDIAVKQVSIEARIVNVTKDCELDLGVRWGVSKPPHLSGTLDGANQLAQGVSLADVTPLSDRLNLDLAAAPASALQPASLGIAVAKLGGGVLLDLELSALESENRAEIISSPRLMTTNQQPATIQSGEDIPYQESTSSGATAVSFKKAVLSLKVTPQITPDGKLLLYLQINQDTNSGREVQGVPIILTKSIETNVLVNNGQTIVLGGIYEQSKSNNIVRIPFLGQIPFLGNLFRRTNVTSKNNELLIFITPRIIANSLSITAIEGKRYPAIARVKIPHPRRSISPH